MRTLPRLVTLVLALALVGCIFLPWIGELTARSVALGSLITPTSPAPDEWFVSMAVPVGAAGVLLLLGAIANSRVFVVIGGLVAVGFPAAWLLVHLLGGESTVVLRTVGAGLYGPIVIGLIALVLSAVTVDANAQTVR